MADEKAELERIAPVDDAPVARAGYPKMPGYPEAMGYGYGYGEQEGLHLRDVWRTINKRKWLILTISFIVTTIVTIEAYRSKPAFAASALVELGKENAMMIKSGTGEMVLQGDETDLYYPEMSIKTKMITLTSEPVLEDVVAGLNLDQNPKFVDGGKKSVWEAVKAIVNRASAHPPDDQTLSVINAPAAGAGAGRLRSAEESERLAPYVGLIAAGLEVEHIKDTRVLRVSYTHTDPVIAAAVVNGIAQTFIESSFQTKTAKFTNASDWLDRTTRELKARVEQAEQKLADYTREHNIFTTDGKETLTTDKLSRLHDQATRAETDRIMKQSLYEEVRQGRVAQLPAAFADPKITTLRNKLDELQAQADKLNLRYGPDYPAVIEVKQEIATARAQMEAARRVLEDKLKGEYELAYRDEQSLKAALGQAKGDAVKQNQDAIQYNILRQEVDTAKGLYTDFLQKTSQAKVEVAQQHNNLKLIQPAKVPKGPVGPGRFRTILFGFLLSLAAGIGLAFFLDYLDNTIKSVEDVGRYAQLPALGVIPAIARGATGRFSAKGLNKRLKGANGSGLVSENAQHHSTSLMALDNRSTAAEAYRVVRTSMLLSAAGNPPKTILVTSGQPGEGKTTTTVNTAISLAQLGSSVLIIDCDLRKPAAHKAFGITHTQGLSTYLSRDIEVDGLIHKLQIPNLSLLPCGPIPPNPAELLSSDRMKNLLGQLAERYDHILIDSPPLVSVTDPVILSTLVDGVILVVHGGKSTRAVVRRARQELSTVGAKVFGVVLNNLDLKRDGYDNYYYQRYYEQATDDVIDG